jgi:hypothetical protein
MELLNKNNCILEKAIKMFMKSSYIEKMLNNGMDIDEVCNLCKDIFNW